MSERVEFWIVGKPLLEVVWPDGRTSLTWEFQGLYSTEEAAVEACTKTSYFVAPVLLDCEIPDERAEWEGLYYPNERK